MDAMKERTEQVVVALVVVIVALLAVYRIAGETSQATFSTLIDLGTSYTVSGHQQLVIANINVTASQAYLNGGFEGSGSWYFVVVEESQYANFSRNPFLAVQLGQNVWDLRLVNPSFNTTMSYQLRQGTYYVVLYNPNDSQVVVNATSDLQLQRYSAYPKVTVHFGGVHTTVPRLLPFN